MSSGIFEKPPLRCPWEEPVQEHQRDPQQVLHKILVILAFPKFNPNSSYLILVSASIGPAFYPLISFGLAFRVLVLTFLGSPVCP